MRIGLVIFLRLDRLFLAREQGIFWTTEVVSTDPFGIWVKMIQIPTHWNRVPFKVNFHQPFNTVSFYPCNLTDNAGTFTPWATCLVCTPSHNHLTAYVLSSRSEAELFCLFHQGPTKHCISSNSHLFVLLFSATRNLLLLILGNMVVKGLINSMPYAWHKYHCLLFVFLFWLLLTGRKLTDTTCHWNNWNDCSTPPLWMIRDHHGRGGCMRL